MFNKHYYLARKEEHIDAYRIHPRWYISTRAPEIYRESRPSRSFLRARAADGQSPRRVMSFFRRRCGR